jgi:hypothetical protein
MKFSINFKRTYVVNGQEVGSLGEAIAKAKEAARGGDRVAGDRPPASPSDQRGPDQQHPAEGDPARECRPVTPSSSAPRLFVIGVVVLAVLGLGYWLVRLLVAAPPR